MKQQVGNITRLLIKEITKTIRNNARKNDKGVHTMQKY